MALKIDTNQSAIAYHIVDGATRFTYAVDARHAISNFPLEWSEDPWSADKAEQARQRYNERAAETGAAQLPEPAPLSPEDQAALDEHNKAVAEAAARLEAYHAKKRAETEEAAQVAADEAMVASLPPAPDPTIKRPFGRKGEPTPAELEQIKKRDAKKADDERMAQEKADADKMAAAANSTVTK